ncbi:MAG TPA: hypothetical protein VD995_26705 [Azospirillum sp.]|nr:hypothetical protein [Azospirillum sp.]
MTDDYAFLIALSNETEKDVLDEIRRICNRHDNEVPAVPSRVLRPLRRPQTCRRTPH